MPIFDEAAEAISKEFPEAGKVVMGKVDCDRESSVATRFHITKYPTLKVGSYFDYFVSLICSSKLFNPNVPVNTPW